MNVVCRLPLALLVLLAVVYGCAPTRVTVRPRPADVPAGFTISLHIEGHSDGHDPVNYTSQYILEPDRQLRVALGKGAARDYYPSLTRRIKLSEMRALYQHTRENHLWSEPTSPGAELHDRQRVRVPVLYTVVLHHEQKTHEYSTTPDESPPTRALVSKLVELRRPILPVAAPQERKKPK